MSTPFNLKKFVIIGGLLTTTVLGVNVFRNNRQSIKRVGNQMEHEALNAKNNLKHQAKRDVEKLKDEFIN